MPKPNLDKISSWYHGYINLVAEDDAKTAINNNSPLVLTFFQTIPDDKWEYRYAEGKWTIKEMLQHIIDTERIFAYRALSFARGEKAPLPGFEEGEYATASKAERRSKNDLISEFSVVRKSTEWLFDSFDEHALKTEGIANNATFTANDIGFILAGHVKHHIKILKERYL